MGIEIVNADSYEHIKSIADNSVDLIVTDPPYDIDMQHSLSKFYQNFKNFHDFDNFKKNLINGIDVGYFIDEFERIQPFRNWYMFCNKNLLATILIELNKRNIRYFDVLVWHKLNPIPAYKFHYMNDLEYIVFVCENKGTMTNIFETSSKVFSSNIGGGMDKDSMHPTEKPKQIIEKFIRNSSVEGQMIYDPFSGSGTTAVVAKSLKRNFIGAEIDEKFYKYSLERLKLVNGVLF